MLTLTTDFDSVPREDQEVDFPHEEQNPEVALARAVILQAIQDAFMGSRGGRVSAPERNAARLFLFAPSGDYAKARRAWAMTADIDPAWLDRRLEHIAGEPEREPERYHRHRRHRVSTQEWDARVIAYLRENGHLPGLRSREKTKLSQILTDAGFEMPRGGVVCPDTLYFFVKRNKAAFADG